LDRIGINMHVHTLFSDGAFMPEEVITISRESGLKVVAITDHCFLSDYFINTVIYPDQDRHPTYVVFDESPDSWEFLEERDGFKNSGIERYLAVLRAMQAGSVEPAVLVGGEVNFPANRLALDEQLQWINKLDFVLFEDVKEPLFEEFIEARAQITCPVGLAHTDFSSAFVNMDCESLANALVDADIFVELNTANALRTTFFYSVRELFEIGRDLGLKISIGSDAHSRPEDISNLDDGESFVRELGLEENLQWIFELAGRDMKRDSEQS